MSEALDPSELEAPEGRKQEIPTLGRAGWSTRRTR